MDKNKRPNIMGLGWWTIVSWNPKMIAISIGRGKYSQECIEYCKEFVLCFPSTEQKNEAWFCGIKSGRNIDKFSETGLLQIPSKIVKPPIIKGSTVAYECIVVDEFKTGDHILYIGNVVAIHGSPNKPCHLYSIHYKSLIGIDFKANINKF